MKTKIFTTFLVSVLFMNTSAQTTYVWDYVSTLQNEWLQKICTQGLDTVYIVGQNGLIAQSADRALTWNKQYTITSQLNDIIFCNHITGFAVGNGGTILKTTDAGVTWTAQSSGTTNNLTAIAATGLDNIWAVGENGTVLFSTNAGVTWQKKDFSISANINDISFRNNIGYIVGNAHTCFESSDYGNSWIIKDIAVDNPNNNPISMFDLRSINQTQNHTCILIGYYFIGHTINIDNSTLIHPSNQGNFVTSFVMKNDSIGYGFWGGCTTGSSGCVIFVQTINLNKIDPYSSTGFDLSPLSSFDDQHSDINFVNDSIEYIISGSSIYHLKRYIPDIHDESNNVINEKLSIKNNSRELTIQFENKKIERIELYTITGVKTHTELINTNETTKCINIAELPKGTYIIRAYKRDNTIQNIKWLKQ